MNIVSLSLAVPYEGVPHAGGQYYLRHVEALARSGHSVLVVAPDTPENRAAEPLAPSGIRVRVVPRTHRPVRDRLERLRSRITAIRPPLGFAAAVAADGTVREALAAADLVELQWTHVMALQPVVRRMVPATVTVVGFAHDVVHQGFARRARRRDAGAGAVALARLRAVQSRIVEPLLLNRMDAVLTFSEKDRDLLRRLRVRARVEVVRPPIAEAAGGPRAPDGRRVLFVGAFDRDENVLGAQWLLDRVWPRVLARHPDAGLEIVGAHPTDGMLERAEGEPSVTVTGFVDELGPFYRRAAVAVVPLLLGAGVKFKTATAMALGVPVVATAIGVEGVLEGADPSLVAVVDDPEGFAAAVTAVLDDPARAEERAAAAQRFAVERFGAAGFAERLDALYRHLRSAPRTRTRTR